MQKSMECPNDRRTMFGEQLTAEILPARLLRCGRVFEDLLSTGSSIELTPGPTDLLRAVRGYRL